MLLLLSLLACDDPELQSQLDALQAQVEAQAETNAALQARLDALESSDESQDGDIASLQGNDALQDLDLEGLRTDVDANSDDLVSLLEDVSEQDIRLTAVEGDIGSLQTVSDGVSPLLDYLSVDTAEDSVVFSGANLYVQSGSGDTFGTVNGVGNLVVGYDEGDPAEKTGSHNLIVGMNAEYTSYGGVVFGAGNASTEQFATVLGGKNNRASGDYATVLTGESCEASGNYSSVYGGFGTDATSSHEYAP